MGAFAGLIWQTGLASVRIGECGHPDMVDVHVALVADAEAAAVITADRDGILAVSPGLAELIVDIWPRPGDRAGASWA